MLTLLGIAASLLANAFGVGFIDWLDGLCAMQSGALRHGFLGERCA